MTLVPPTRAPADAAASASLAPALPLWQGVLHTVLVGLATWALSWQAGALTRTHVLVWLMALCAAALAVVAARRGRIASLELWMLEASALAAASGATGLWAWHLAFKPAAMAIAIIFVASNAYQSSARGQFSYKSWGFLLAALLASLAGDVFLMLQDLFIPGLVSFLLAHLAYIALFGRRVRWLAHGGALLVTVGIGAAMYAWLWQGGLPAELRAPVAVYVLVIALMAAQALGRAAQLQTEASRTVALGACIFMLSDSVLAVDRFVQPVPLALFWVLATYYAAQFCIVHGMVRHLRGQP
ncbi:lysoplasmalogenase [Simplicispira suum]|nr:lysoplasmalogenase [Simplicispira suum]